MRRGTYAPIPIDATGDTKTITNPWVLVPTLFAPGYVGGWSAAEHWDLTEQIFRDVCVFTASKFRSSRVEIEGTPFILHKVSGEKIFGTETLWESGTKIQVSDLHRTIVDMMDRPETGGGIDHASSCLGAYLASKRSDPGTLIEYGRRLRSGAVFKRLGFLLEQRGADGAVLAACRSHLTSGYAKLDPALPADRLVTRWRLWVPASWKVQA